MIFACWWCVCPPRARHCQQKARMGLCLLGGCSKEENAVGWWAAGRAAQREESKLERRAKCQCREKAGWQRELIQKSEKAGNLSLGHQDGRAGTAADLKPIH